MSKVLSEIRFTNGKGAFKTMTLIEGEKGPGIRVRTSVLIKNYRPEEMGRAQDAFTNWIDVYKNEGWIETTEEAPEVDEMAEAAARYKGLE